MQWQMKPRLSGHEVVGDPHRHVGDNSTEGEEHCECFLHLFVGESHINEYGDADSSEHPEKRNCEEIPKDETNGHQEYKE